MASISIKGLVINRVFDGVWVVLPKFGPELRFEPELMKTGPKFSPEFRYFAELNAGFDSGFKQSLVPLNVFKLGSNRTLAYILYTA